MKDDPAEAAPKPHSKRRPRRQLSNDVCCEVIGLSRSRDRTLRLATRKVAKVILGVGGVLGLGEHYVVVGFDKLKWVDQPVTSTTASTTSTPANAPGTTSVTDGTTRTTTGAATTTTTTTTTSASRRWYPDHAVYNATKDELKTMPEFKY